MSEMPQAAPPTPLRRRDKLLLVCVSTPFLGGCSAIAIALLGGLVGYGRFGGAGWGVVSWTLGQFAACLLLTLALALLEGLKTGGLAIYTWAGVAAGVVASLTMGWHATGVWIPPLQYALIGHLLGRIAYRGVNRPDFQGQ